MELTCRNCGGDLTDRGGYYECYYCGKRYEKTVPKPAPVVSAPAPKEEKPVPKPEEQKEEEIGWEEWLERGCEILYNMGFLNAVMSLKNAETCYKNIIFLIYENEPEKDRIYAFNKFITVFLGAYYRASLYFEFSFKEYTDNKKWLHKKLDTSIALFLQTILVCTENALYSKMVAERAYSVFDFLCEESDILKHLKVLEEIIGDKQKEITSQYWEEHSKKLKKLIAERNSLCEIVDEYNELLDKAEIAKQEAEKICSEISGVRDCYNRAWNRSIGLNFFQKKEKKKLEEEMHNLVVSENNLKEKLKLCEKEEEKINKRAEKKWEGAHDSLLRINEIDSDLDANHYPGEEEFVEMFEKEIRKTAGRFM